MNVARALKFAAIFIALAVAACEDGDGSSYRYSGSYYGRGYSWNGSYGYGPYGFGYGPYGYGYYGERGYRPYYWYGRQYYKHH